MSLNLKKLSQKILQEYYGDIVAKIACVLLTNGTTSLKLICASAKLPIKKVKESLCTLIKHNLVVWENSKNNIPGYTLIGDRVLLIIRFPRYVYLIRDSFGEEAEMVTDVLLKEGQVTASQIIINATLKLLEASDEGTYTQLGSEERHITIRNSLSMLIEKEFIQRAPDPMEEKVNEEELFRFSADWLDCKLIKEEIDKRRSNSKQNGFNSVSGLLLNHPDANIFWRMNYDKFHLEFRDIEICQSISRRVDSFAGRCLKAALKASYARSDPWCPVLNPIQFGHIQDHCRDQSYLDQYLKVIEENGGGCLRKVGDAGGGEFVVDIAASIKTLTRSIIASVIQERFGSKASRIFRLIQAHGMMEQDQIAELSMIAKKEANQLTDCLKQDNFLSVHEVRKSYLPVPNNKGIFLFHIDENSIVRMLIERHFKILYNLIGQRNMQYAQNSRLLERKTRVETIVENLKQSGGSEEQIQEVEEMVTAGEKESIEKVLTIQDKLFESETEIDETLFILQLYLYYQLHK